MTTDKLDNKEEIKVFMCRPILDSVNVQLSINKRTLDHFKQVLKDDPKCTVKQYMENILNSYAERRTESK
jgi:hypothetical protein